MEEWRSERGDWGSGVEQRIESGGRSEKENRRDSLARCLGSMEQERKEMEERKSRNAAITKAELSRHNSASDLWVSIKGKVYDVTGWLQDHPGGDLPLLNLAGQDVTDAFVAFHPAAAWAVLDRYYIGRLTDYEVSEVCRDYRGLAGEFAKMGLFERKGHGCFFALAAMVALLSTAFYLVVANSDVLSHMAAAAILGFLWMQSGFLGHDSGHYIIMPNRKLNRMVQIVTGNCIAGISIAWWKHNHNAHHIACNSLNFDPDLQHIPLFAVSRRLFDGIKSEYHKRVMHFDGFARFFVGIQHWTFYPVMCVARINLFAQSTYFILSPKNHVPQRWAEILGVVVFWIWYPWMVSLMPSWWERAAFVLVSFAVTGIQHVQFTLNHFSAGTYLGNPKGDDWFEKQTRGTINISCPPWMDWFHGGLHYQVEHHLFPRLPRCNLRRVAPRVRELCKKHGLQYSSYSFFEANMRTLRTLHAAAVEARKMTDGPVPKNLVWEAVNTHG